MAEGARVIRTRPGFLLAVVAERAGRLRASRHLYTSDSDIDRLLDALPRLPLAQRGSTAVSTRP